MGMFRPRGAVPAYIGTVDGFRSAPFIVTLLLYDGAGQPRLTPAVEAAIDRNVAFTGRVGLATLMVADDADLASERRTIRAAMMVEDAIILFRCQRAGTAERLMQYLDRIYQLELVQEAPTGPAAW